jgi:hypothetical protein
MHYFTTYNYPSSLLLSGGGAPWRQRAFACSIDANRHAKSICMLYRRKSACKEHLHTLSMQILEHLHALSMQIGMQRAFACSIDANRHAKSICMLYRCKAKSIRMLIDAKQRAFACSIDANRHRRPRGFASMENAIATQMKGCARKPPFSRVFALLAKNTQATKNERNTTLCAIRRARARGGGPQPHS